MGGLCSKGSAVAKSPSDATLGHDPAADAGPSPMQAVDAAAVKRQRTEVGAAASGGPDAVEPQLCRNPSQKAGLSKAGAAKVSEVSSMLGRVSSVGLGKAVEVLDTLGSSMTNLNIGNGFVSGGLSKNKISILSFEVANTIMKGYNLMRSLSKDNVKHLKDVVLKSEGVRNLISADMDELLRIAAADKREELNVFSKEVVRFGNRCKDPQWHNLDRYFDKFASEHTLQLHLKEEAEEAMHELMESVQYTAELYHELHALDRFEQDYQRKQKENNPNVVQRGENLQTLKQEVKSQSKHVKNLKKRSLWSKNLEEVIEKLVDIVHFLHLEIRDAIGINDREELEEATHCSTRLGPAGLALHYASIVSQIDTLVSRSSAIPTNSRDALYQGLPPDIKSVLRVKLQSFEVKEELTATHIKVEMERTLRWLVPMASNTTKAHHGFGWVGEWANTGSEVNSKPAGQLDLLRIETLHHADKSKLDAYILDLVVWLHHLISKTRPANGSAQSPVKSPVRSPSTQRSLSLSLSKAGSVSVSSPLLTQEDQEMLRGVKFRRNVPGISKSQEFARTKSRLGSHSRLCKSNSHSPTSSTRKDFFAAFRRPSMLPVIDFELDRSKALDLIDRVDDINML